MRDLPANSFPAPVAAVLEHTSSVMARVIADRRDRGVEPYPSAIVFPRAGWWFAVVKYGAELGNLVFHLDRLEAGAIEALQSRRLAA